MAQCLNDTVIWRRRVAVTASYKGVGGVLISRRVVLLAGVRLGGGGQQ